MPSRVFFTPSAKQDVTEAKQWYSKESESLAKRFVEDLQAATNRISNNADQYSIVYRDVRQCRLTDFPYVISFRIAIGIVEVLAVLHGSRDPRLWKRRS